MAKQITKTEMSGHMFMLCLWIPQSSTITNINMVFARIISHHTKDPAAIRKERWMDELASKVCNGTRKSWQNNLDIEANPFTMTTEKYSYAVSSHACREVRITHLGKEGIPLKQVSPFLPSFPYKTELKLTTNSSQMPKLWKAEHCPTFSSCC